MRTRLLLGAFGLGLLAALPAAASTVEFRIRSTCLTDCANIGIGPNETLVGFLTLSTAGFAPGGALTKSDVTDFSVVFGVSETLIAFGVSPGFDFAATWGATSGSVEGVRFVASGADSLLTPGPFVSFGPLSNVASLDTACDDADCAKMMVESVAGLSPLSVTEPSFLPPVPVPLPPAVLLMGTGILGLLTLARRRPGHRAGAARAGA